MITVGPEQDRGVTTSAVLPKSPEKEDEYGEALVFRDFEGSRIQALRDEIRKRPAQFTVLFSSVILLWTVMMSAATSLHGNKDVFLNLTPHVAHFTIVLGIFFFPLRLIWIPLLTYLVIFAYVLLQKVGLNESFMDLSGMSLKVAGGLFALNILSGLVLGLLYLGLFKKLMRVYRPFLADSYFALAAIPIFVVVGFAQIAATAAFIQTFDADTLTLLGASDHQVLFPIFRMIRGGVVIGAFLLAATERPTLRSLPEIIPYIGLFVVLGFAHELGFSLFPMLDATALALVIILSLRVEQSILTCILGIAAYSAITGQFLNDSFDGDHHVLVLNIYALLGLNAIVLIAAMRARAKHVTEQKDASIRRLNQVRFLAGIGLFAINLQSRTYRLDESAARILASSQVGKLDDLLKRFAPFHRGPVETAMETSAGAGLPHEFKLAPNIEPSSAHHVLLYIWYEYSPTGAKVAFGLVHDISIDHDRKKRLQSALTRLSEQQEHQRQLFSIVSHELRTPASVLSMLIDDLAEASDQPQDRTKIIGQMRGTADHLLSVMGDMRQAVNPEKNMPIKRAPYIPAELAESVMHSLDLTSRQMAMTVHLNLGKGADRPKLGDIMRVRQTLTNLVRNAILHSKGSTVELGYDVDIAEGTTYSRWTVVDNGAGIPEEDVVRMFEPFERGGNDPQKRADGSGLGLFIARSAMQLLGGTLTHFQPASGGTGFVIRVPEAEAKLSDFAQPETTTDIAALPRLKILLAEDNSLVGEVMVSRLQKDFGEVVHALNGRHALDLIADLNPDLVITDLFMPEMDGDELIRQLRSQGFAKPIIGISAAVVGAETDRFYQAGADAVMEKPMNSQLLRKFLTEGFPAKRMAAQ